jgi:NADH-quinone oxidoreductase subunit A
LASVAIGYLPILMFLAIALALSTAFVVLPMLVSRLTGTHRPDQAKLAD